jgi:hypothetical protein
VAVDMYNTRTMLQALRQMKRAKTFLRDTFFNNVRTFTTKYVDIDIVKGGEEVAGYVSPMEEGTVVTRKGYETNSYEPPYISLRMPLTAADIQDRQPGENIYDALAPGQRAINQMADDLFSLDEMITRAEEKQAAQALFTGAVVLTNEKGRSDSIDFRQDITHKVTDLTYRWDDYETSHPLDDILSWSLFLIDEGGLTPNIAIMASDVVPIFLNHPDIKGNSARFSQVNVERGQVRIELLPNGAVKIGTMSDTGVEIYSYPVSQRPVGGGSKVALVPSGNFFLGSTSARMDRLYGLIQDLKALAPVDRFVKSWEEEHPSVRYLLMQSAPLLVPGGLVHEHRGADAGGVG